MKKWVVNWSVSVSRALKAQGLDQVLKGQGLDEALKGQGLDQALNGQGFDQVWPLRCALVPGWLL